MPEEEKTASFPTTVSGDVHTGGGDFIGRDHIQHQVNIYQQEPNTRPRAPKTKFLVHRYPDNFIPRTEIYNQICDHITNTPPNGRSPFTLLFGIGGVGKTALATALCYNPKIQEKFVDGIYWVTVGQSGSITDKIAKLGESMGDTLESYYNPEFASSNLKRFLENKTVLIVLDDVWNPKDLQSFNFDYPGCHLLVTTRGGRKIGQDVNAKCFNIEVFKPEEAVQLLEEITGQTCAEYFEIARRLGYLPLAIRLAGKRLKNDLLPAVWLEKYSTRISQLKTSIHSNTSEDSLTACFDLSMEQFSDSHQALYYSLGVFPEDTSVPISLLLRFWDETKNRRGELEDLMDEFINLELVQTNKGTTAVRLHDLLHDYARKKLGDDTSQHQRRFLQILNPQNLPWYQVELDSYLYEHLPYHLVEAGCQNELTVILQDLTRWMSSSKENPKPGYEALTLKLWSALWRTDEARAKAFYQTVWLRKTLPDRKSKANIAKKLAVRCAFEVNYIDGLVLALRSPDDSIRSAGVNYTFYISNKNGEARQERTLYVLRSLVEHCLVMGLFPNINVLKSIFQLAPLIIIDQYQENAPDTRYLDEVILLLRQAFNKVTNQSVLRVVGAQARTGLIWMMVNIYRGLMTKAKSDTVNNLPGYNRFFSKVSPLGQQNTINAVRYLDRTAGSIHEISDTAVHLFRNNDRISILINEFILIGQGTQQPDEIASILQRLAQEMDSSGGSLLLSVTHIWYSILARLPKEQISETHLTLLRQFVSQWLESGPRGYGVIEYMGDFYNYYPLAYYTAIWTKVHPGTAVDLVAEYYQQAQANANVKLHAHIIASFSDFRQQYWDYPTVLNILLPYLHHAAPQEIRDALVNTLGSLRGRLPGLVDEFLKNNQAPADIVNDIYCNSYQLSIKPYERFYQVLSDLVIYAPKTVVDPILSILVESLSSKSVEEMISKLANRMVAKFLIPANP